MIRDTKLDLYTPTSAHRGRAHRPSWTSLAALRASKSTRRSEKTRGPAGQCREASAVYMSEREMRKRGRCDSKIRFHAVPLNKPAGDSPPNRFSLCTGRKREPTYTSKTVSKCTTYTTESTNKSPASSNGTSTYQLVGDGVLERLGAEHVVLAQDHLYDTT